MKPIIPFPFWRVAIWAFPFVGNGPLSAAAPVGRFEDHGDIGQTAKAGSVEYDPERKTYAVTGGGENMWFAADALYFAWRRMSGDFTLAADIQFAGAGGNAHRKACLLIRQSLAPDSAYADAVLHGDGLTSLQYRESSGAPTREIQSNVSRPIRLRLEKEGDFVAMSVAREGEPLRPTGGSFKIQFTEPFYIGLGVCAHDNRVLEQAIFSNVEITAGMPRSAANAILESTLETVAIASKDRRVAYHARSHLEAPNWSRDGNYFIFSSQGRIYRLGREGGEPQIVNTGFAGRCNSHHGLSPDGAQLAISHQAQGGESMIYLLPIAGGAPKQITPYGPSYWHGWSPDGKTIAYGGERHGNYDIFSIPADGGEEQRLTTANGLDGGPDYTADGKYIYFHSDRTGAMKIWRMKPDGSAQEQVTVDEANDWFPHPSPDGRWIVFLSCAPSVKTQPANQDVQLRLMPVGGGEIQVLAKLLGGQGTIDAPSWSPDSRNVAFVSYRRVRVP